MRLARLRGSRILCSRKRLAHGFRSPHHRVRRRRRLVCAGGRWNGRGELYDQEDFEARTVFVRFEIMPLDADNIRFEQALPITAGRPGKSIGWRWIRG